MSNVAAAMGFFVLLPDDDHRRAILSEATKLLTQLTLRNEGNLEEVRGMESVAGPLTEEFLKAAGATEVGDDEPKSN